MRAYAHTPHVVSPIQELLKEHQKKIEAYGAAKAKTAKEKSAKKQNPIKVVEAEREESSSKQVLEDSERDMLNALQQVLKKNNKEMLAVVTSAYVAGLQAFFATGVEKVQGLKAQLHDKVAEEEHDEDADVPEERAKEASKPEERGTHTARDVFLCEWRELTIGSWHVCVQWLVRRRRRP
jgi:hypothetical protein